MPRTHAFQFGDGQAILIPAEIAYADIDIELEITRLGDVITIVPAPRVSLSDAIAVLRQMPKPAAAENREPIDMPLRNQN